MNFGREEVFAQGENFRGYTVMRLLGNGALGAVYLVRHDVLDVYYALKVLFPSVAEDNPAYVKRFMREAKIATRIRHQNLVAVHDCGFDETKGVYFIVMDYVAGGDLRQALAFAGTFSVDRAVEVVLQVASALESAQHYHVVHRDIKPENIMIEPSGLVKLVDLGIAKSEDLKDSLQTSTESVFGTPAYIAPEQALDASDVDSRADIYSLGVVLFEMIAGRAPFAGESAPQVLAESLSSDPFPDIRDVAPSVDPALAVLIRRMCVKERERRIPNPTALIAEFAKLGYAPKGRMNEPVRTTPSIEAQATRISVKAIVDRLPPEKGDNTLSFETQDVEIQEFVSRLKRRRAVRKLLFIVGIAAIVIIIAVMLLST